MKPAIHLVEERIGVKPVLTWDLLPGAPLAGHGRADPVCRVPALVPSAASSYVCPVDDAA
jgi:hypothetical protein